jgi:hypothetical protein
MTDANRPIGTVAGSSNAPSPGRATRRLAEDDERTVQTSETLIDVAMMRVLLARFGRSI